MDNEWYQKAFQAETMPLWKALKIEMKKAKLNIKYKIPFWVNQKTFHKICFSYLILKYQHNIKKTCEVTKKSIANRKYNKNEAKRQKYNWWIANYKTILIFIL